MHYPKRPITKPTILGEIAGIPVWVNTDESLSFVAPAMICVDGEGDAHGDPHFQAQTALRQGARYLNADEERYIVLPPGIIKAVPGIVLGCQATIQNGKTLEALDCVVGDVGPKRKLGEISRAAAIAAGINADPIRGGESRARVIYRVWPGIPAKVMGMTYTLQQYGA